MKCVYTILFILLCFSVRAQFAESEYNANDSLKTSYLDELVISANKLPELRRTVAQQIKLISPATIRNLNAQNSADLISNTG